MVGSFISPAHRTTATLYAALGGKYWFKNESRWPVDDMRKKSMKTVTTGMACPGAANPHPRVGVNEIPQNDGWIQKMIWLCQIVIFLHSKSLLLYSFLTDSFALNLSASLFLFSPELLLPWDRSRRQSKLAQGEWLQKLNWTYTSGLLFHLNVRSVGEGTHNCFLGLRIPNENAVPRFEMQWWNLLFFVIPPKVLSK